MGFELDVNKAARDAAVVGAVVGVGKRVKDAISENVRSPIARSSNNVEFSFGFKPFGNVRSIFGKLQGALDKAKNKREIDGIEKQFNQIGSKKESKDTLPPALKAYCVEITQDLSKNAINFKQFKEMEGRINSYQGEEIEKDFYSQLSKDVCSNMQESKKNLDDFINMPNDALRIRNELTTKKKGFESKCQEYEEIYKLLVEDLKVADNMKVSLQIFDPSINNNVDVIFRGKKLLLMDFGDTKQSKISEINNKWLQYMIVYAYIIFTHAIRTGRASCPFFSRKKTLPNIMSGAPSDRLALEKIYFSELKKILNSTIIFRPKNVVTGGKNNSESEYLKEAWLFLKYVIQNSECKDTKVTPNLSFYLELNDKTMDNILRNQKLKWISLHDLSKFKFVHEPNLFFKLLDFKKLLGKKPNFYEKLKLDFQQYNGNKIYDLVEGIKSCYREVLKLQTQQKKLLDLEKSQAAVKNHFKKWESEKVKEKFQNSTTYGKQTLLKRIEELKTKWDKMQSVLERFGLANQEKQIEYNNSHGLQKRGWTRSSRRNESVLKGLPAKLNYEDYSNIVFSSLEEIKQYCNDKIIKLLKSLGLKPQAQTVNLETLVCVICCVLYVYGLSLELCNKYLENLFYEKCIEVLKKSKPPANSSSNSSSNRNVLSTSAVWNRPR